MLARVFTAVVSVALASSSFADDSPADQLYNAAGAGDLDTVKRLLDSGVSPNSPSVQKGTEFGDLESWPINNAAQNGKPEVIRMLLDHGAKIDSKDYQGSRAIHFAVQAGSFESVKLLIDQGVSPNLPTDAWEDGPYQPIYFAAASGNLKLLEYLIGRGAKVTEASGVMNGAVQGKNLDLMKYLLAHGGSLTWKGPDGEQLIHAAVWNQDISMLRFLIEHGASPAATDKHGTQPLHLAAFYGNLQAVILLLEKGADANIPTNSKQEGHFQDGWRPLHFAANPQLMNPSGETARPYVEAIRLFISKGADVNGADRDGNTPLHLAACEEVARLLIDNGAKVDVLNNQKELPIHRAAFDGNVAIIRMLLDHGSSLAPEDHEGQTPLDVAAFWSKTEAMTFFLEKGVKPTERTMINSLYFGELGHLPLLQKFGGKITAPVFLASQRAQDDLVPLLDKETMVAVSGTLLPAAVESGDLAAVENLIKAGAAIDAVANSEGCCPDDESKGAQAIHYAAALAEPAILDLLLKHGAKPDASTDAGVRPLHIAASSGRKANVQSLLAAGADRLLKAPDGKTAEELAKEAGYPAIYKMIAAPKE